MAPRRKNGFERPFGKMQVAASVTMPVLLVQFLFFCAPVLPIAASIPFTLIFFGVAAGATYYAFQATVVDPMDVHLAHHLLEQTEDSNTAGSNGNAANGTAASPPPQDASSSEGASFWYKPASTEIPPDEATKYCWVCETYVAEHAMHCKYCNKCISNFDHHCQWLNTCVGKANYQTFYKTLWYLCAFLVMHVGIMLGLVIDYFLDGSTLDRARDWFQADVPAFVAAVWILFLIFDGIALFLMGQLLLFHIGLRREGLTTYQYIVRDSQRKRDASEIKDQRASQRIRAEETAKEEGKLMLALRLQLGEYCCSACDPLPADVASSKSPDDNHADLGEAQHDEQEEKLQRQPVTSSSSLSDTGVAITNGHTISSNGTEEEDVASATATKQAGVIWEKV